MRPSTPLTQERLKQLLRYEPATGIFTWLVLRGAARPGQIAGHANAEGYLDVCVDYRLYLCHRLAWLYMTGIWPQFLVDHRNRRGLDNRLDNLRLADYSGNAQNIDGPHRDSTTGVLGVYPHGKRFRSRIMVGGKDKCLGVFASIKEAADAYLAAKKELHPFYSTEA